MPKVASQSRPPKRVTLEQVASATGLGRTTISDILNRDAGNKYSQSTRDRVLQAVQELGYSPVRAAQQLARGRSGQIGLMLTRDFSNPFFARVADLVEREVRRLGYRLQIAITDGDPDTERERIQQLHSDAVEGLIVGPVYEHLDIEQHLQVLRGGLPIVLFGGLFETDYDLIALDHDAGTRLALEHLLARGHRKIGYLCAPPSRTAPDEPNMNHSAYRIFAERGLVRPDWFVWQPDFGRFEDFHAACVRFGQAWKQMPPNDRPTAMFCHNDQVAMTAINAFGQLGIRVPQDLSLVGYDNLPESAYLVPALTTVDNRVQLQMTRAVERLRQRIRTLALPAAIDRIEPGLVVRNSVFDRGG